MTDFEAGEAPPDVALLADFVEAVEGATLPSQAALEEAVLLVERYRGAGLRVELRRRWLRRAFEAVRAAYPGASAREVSRLAARRLGVSAETVRSACRPVGE